VQCINLPGHFHCGRANIESTGIAKENEAPNTIGNLKLTA